MREEEVFENQNRETEPEQTLLKFPKRETDGMAGAYAGAEEAAGQAGAAGTPGAQGDWTGTDGAQTGQADRKTPKKKGGFWSELFSWLQVIVAAVAIAFVLNNFIIANSEVPTGSMIPTINEGNRVIGSRLSYAFGDPERSDIAIFKFGWICENCKRGMGESPAPAVCPNCGKEIKHPKTLYYVKRVIGMPGDVIDIKAEGSVKASELESIPPGLVDAPSDEAELVTAAVYVNGEKIDEPYLREPMLYTGDMHFEVPKDCYFMLGDNRNDSGDARYWNNPYISKDKMVAKVMFRYFPSPKILK